MKNYDHTKIEKKWQKEWDKKKIYEVKNGTKGKKFYGLIEFPYPSGAGLHVGHIRSNTAMDIITRKRRMEGYKTLFPIGWDAFGLPTENYAIKTGIQPEIVTKQNTDVFRKQLKEIGFGFDWAREVNTTDPKYYKWTQWIFLQLYKKGLAYKAKSVINWCPQDKIGLANEEVVNGACERCGTAVVKKEKEQWMLAITKYADRLDKDLDDVDYLDKIKIQQRNWIGKSEGAEIDFKIKGFNEKIKIFTTRADTIYGATYIVLAPEHQIIKELKSQTKNLEEVEKYISVVKKKTEIERTDDKEKTGVELKGIKAINPANSEEISVWVADYVLASYGTGAVMAVPAHDERDFEFAKKYGLIIKDVVSYFYQGQGENTVRPDAETLVRDVVDAVIENTQDEFLLQREDKNGVVAIHFVGGGKDGEEDLLALKREVVEETGYTNFEILGKIPVGISAHAFRHTKLKNQKGFGYGYHVKLKDNNQIRSEVEDGKHSLLWVEKSKVKDLITWPHHLEIWNTFLNSNKAFTRYGLLINSNQFNGLTSEEACVKITKAVGGKIVTKFKIRDWIFSRQRYWGEPIPIIHCEKCGYIPVKESDLPVTLPKVKSYVPTDTGESPLAIIDKWVNTKCPKCKGKAKRETDTMPNWAGSSWYFLRYADPKDSKEFASKKSLKYWMKNGVDWYNGGMEHTTLHLLYSRFWHKFLYDLKLVPTSEPYMKRTSHGMILAENGAKMSKSLGNTVDPKDIVKSYGADTLRVYEMFIGPFDQAVSWSTDSIIGSRRFLEKVWKLKTKVAASESNLSGPRGKSPDHDKLLSDYALFATLLHKTIKKVTEDIERMNFNTAISSMMVLVNEMEKLENIPKKDFKLFLQILAPFAPHITEELWKDQGEKKSIHLSEWPKWDVKKIIDENIKIVVQVNGKVRTELIINKDTEEEEIKAKALKDKAIIQWIEDKEVKRVIYVKGRLVNIVV